MNRINAAFGTRGMLYVLSIDIILFMGGKCNRESDGRWEKSGADEKKLTGIRFFC